MQDESLTLGRLLKIWWLVIWRGAVIGVVAGMITGMIAGAAAGFIAAAQGHPEQAKTAGAAAGFAAGMIVYFPVALLVLRMALRKRYKDFRIELVPIDAASSVKL